MFLLLRCMRSRRFAAFPRVSPEQPSEYIARLTGGWMLRRYADAAAATDAAAAATGAGPTS